MKNRLLSAVGRLLSHLPHRWVTSVDAVKKAGHESQQRGGRPSPGVERAGPSAEWFEDSEVRTCEYPDSTEVIEVQLESCPGSLASHEFFWSAVNYEERLIPHRGAR